ncbi:MAG: hypothetical protein LQ343_007512 [Gyalolechia ehrenbergii]|nr:MAG: hypothetical protein LQ343_007512 [Gyalolechia ehrenbergii]
MIDFSEKWNTADKAVWKHVSKKRSLSESDPPSLNEGAIYSNGTSFWLYGGKVSEAFGENLPPIPPNGIWRYDLAADRWSQPSAGGDPVQRLAQGSPVQSGNSKAFYLGGLKNPFGDTIFGAQPNVMPYLVQGLLVFDEGIESFRNVSTTGLNHLGTVVGGFLSSIDTLGSQGVLFAFGGYSVAVGAAFDERSLDQTFPNAQWPMQNISVYDIANDRWYQQQATGDVPPGRYHGCSLAVSAVDQTSHSIYIFGGFGASNPQQNDGNVYVLSIPSFRWIRVTLDQDQRFRHTCHLMGKNHKVVVGGVTPTDISLPLGITGCDSNPKFNQGLGIFSLNNHTWSTDYNPFIGSAPYWIHPSISKVIGGNATGGATKWRPDNNFSSDGLRNLLHVQNSEANTSAINASAPTDPPTDSKPTPGSKSSRSLSIGATAGMIVGIACFLIFSFGLFMFLRSRRRYRQQSSTSPTSESHLTPAISRPINHTEVYAGPGVPEVRSGNLEDSLARMYRSHEMSNSPERYGMPTFSERHMLPSLSETGEIDASRFVKLPSTGFDTKSKKKLPDLPDRKGQR